MGIRFRRSVKIAPGVRLNVGKKSASIRVGGRGFGVTSGTAGTRVSAGIPGTGLYATQKISGSSSARRSAASTPRRIPAPSQERHVTLNDATTQLGPRENGFTFPGWWLTGAVVCMLAVFGGAFGALALAAPCVYMVWRRLNSPRYKAMKSLQQARVDGTSASDEVVRQAAAQNEDSWTIQREAGLYFMTRQQPEWAVGYLGKALNMFPGDKRPLVAVTAAAALDAGHLDYAISVLEPYLVTANPDESDLDAVLVSTLALALQKSGDASRALEVVNRLPLRRRNLDQPLLLGLCVRALAKHSLGKKADAKRDIDRAYAADPAFPFLEEAQAAMAAAESATV